MKKLTLKKVLNLKPQEDKEISIYHKRLDCDFDFLIPNYKEMSIITKDMNHKDLIKLLSNCLITKIDNDILEELKVLTVEDALMKLFTEDEAIIVVGSLIEMVDDISIEIKKK